MLPIITYPNPILRNQNKDIVDPTSPDIKHLISQMLETLRAQKGLGLAAPQVGKNLNLCIAEIEDEVFVLINPRIKTLTGKKITIEEGCLSFPGKFLPIERYDRIKVAALDVNGQKQVIRARGILSRVIQHEVDHLVGKLFVDRVETVK